MPNSEARAALEQRLIGCFQAVFPVLDEAQILSADNASIEDWDSVAALSLVDVIEEEFGVDLDLEVAVELTSFQAIADHLESQQ